MQILPIKISVFSCLQLVNILVNCLHIIALTISEFYLYLQIVKYTFTNKGKHVVANLLKPYNPLKFNGFFYLIKVSNFLTC